VKSLYDELLVFQERMHRKSKARFRDYLKTKAEQSNLSFRITPNNRFSKNVVVGNLKEARYVFGAHYDTPPRMPSFLMKSVLFFNVITIIFFIILFFIPVEIYIKLIVYILFCLYVLGFLGFANKHNHNDNTSGVLTVLYLMKVLKNDKVAYVFFDNEEKGLIGSMQLMIFMKKNKINQHKKRFFVFDCVGRGELFKFMSYKKNNRLPSKLKNEFDKLSYEGYQVVLKKGNSLEMSDHRSFKYYTHVGIMAYEKQRKKYVMKNIHSHKDKSINLKNIEVISNTIEEYMKGENYE